MQVKVVSMFPTKKEGSKLKAFATVELYTEDGMGIKIGDLKIAEGTNGLFVGMPSKSYQSNKGETVWSNICDVNDSLAKLINDKVLEVYNTGVGLEKPALGIKKSFGAKTSGSSKPAATFPATKPVTAKAPAFAASTPEEDIPF